jgi:hypothetical protein
VAEGALDSIGDPRLGLGVAREVLGDGLVHSGGACLQDAGGDKPRPYVRAGRSRPISTERRGRAGTP